MQVTTASTRLFGFSPPLPAILQPRAALVVLCAGRRQSSKLEVALIQNPIDLNGNRVARS
jgi:hypothetical protein